MNNRVSFGAICQAKRLKLICGKVSGKRACLKFREMGPTSRVYDSNTGKGSGSLHYSVFFGGAHGTAGPKLSLFSLKMQNHKCVWGIFVEIGPSQTYRIKTSRQNGNLTSSTAGFYDRGSY